MAAITISERQHWKKRIESKLDAHVHQLRRSSADLIDAITQQAKEKVAARLDVQADFDRHAEIEGRLKSLTEEKERLLEDLALQVYGDDLPYHVSLRNIESEIQCQADTEAEEILMAHPLGQQIARLKEERETLCDQALLACSVSQISSLLDRVDELTSEPREEVEAIDLPLLQLSEYSLQH